MRALIVVDVQNDFLPGGALAVPEGDRVIPVINRLAPGYELVVATQDWHPAGHESFASQHEGHAPGEVIELHGLTQVLWPDHCVQGSAGAELADALEQGSIRQVFRKGKDAQVDSYSGFFDNGRRGDTGLAAWLREQGVDAVDVVGLATDYCVKFTALDAAEQGFATRVVADACRGVNLQPGDDDRALAELRETGIEVIDSGAIVEVGA